MSATEKYKEVIIKGDRELAKKLANEAIKNKEDINEIIDEFSEAIRHVGDFAQIGASIYLALTLNSWSFAVIFTIAITVVLIILRIIALAKPEYLW
ncbi:MAG: B12-binding domain-containing protein, partial [Candidatus Heimdallarchaeota archaeon]